MIDVNKKIEIINNKRTLYQSLIIIKKEELTSEEIDIMNSLAKDKDIKNMFDEDGNYKFNFFKKTT